MLKMYGVFLAGPGAAYIPLAFFIREQTAEAYVEMRQNKFPYERLIIEAWLLDDKEIIKELKEEDGQTADIHG